jgi:hypothetical protein
MSPVAPAKKAYTKASTELPILAIFKPRTRVKSTIVEKMSQAKSRIGRTIFARLDENEDLLNAIKQRAEWNQVRAGFFFVIGTVKKAILGFYKDANYKPIQLSEPLEIVCCTGNVSVREDAELIVHAHIAVGNEEGHLFGGHVLPGCVIGVTGELTLVETPDAKLKRVFKEKLNLYLWSLGE